MIVEPKLRRFCKITDQPIKISNESISHMNATEFYRQAPQGRDDSLRAEKWMRQNRVASVAVSKSDTTHAVNGDEMLVRENHVVQKVDWFCVNGKH